MTRSKWLQKLVALSAALLIAPSGFGQAAAATFSFTVYLQLESNTALEVVSTPSSDDDEDWVQVLCFFGQPCFPNEFKPQTSFPTPRRATAQFSRTADGTDSCAIGGTTIDCFLSSFTPGPLPVVDFFTFVGGNGSLLLDFNLARLIYEGEAGSYFPLAEPGCPPIIGDFCDYSGQRVSFQITGAKSDGVLFFGVVPTPASLPLAATSLLLLVLIARNRRRRLQPVSR